MGLNVLCHVALCLVSCDCLVSWDSINVRLNDDCVLLQVVDQFEELKKLTSLDGGTKIYRKRQNR